MSLIGRYLAATNLATPEKWLVEWFTGPQSGTGLTVTTSTAQRLTAVTAALRVISETEAVVPLPVYRKRSTGGKDRADAHPLYRVLRNQANPWQTAYEFRRMMTWHAAAGGAAYAQIVQRGDGAIEALVPLLPSRVRPDVLVDGSIVYRYTQKHGPERVFRFEEVFKLLPFSEDGVTSKSLVEVCQEAVGVGLAAEDFVARFYGNSAVPGGVLTHPSRLSKESAGRLRDEWKKRFSAEKTGSVAVLEEGMKFESIGMALKDAQFLESRKFQVTEIARMFRLPPHLLADLERSTNNNIEHQSLEFVTYSMSSWFVMWEQAIWRDLLTETEQADYFAEHLLDALLRGDITSRYSAYAVGRQWGWLSANDVRERENMNPVEDGDLYLSPMNMTPAGQIPDPTLPNPVTPAASRAALGNLLAEPLRRVARREAQVLAGATKKSGGLTKALEGHGAYVVSAVTPIAREVITLLGGSPDGALDRFLAAWSVRLVDDAAAHWVHAEATERLLEAESALLLASLSDLTRAALVHRRIAA